MKQAIRYGIVALMIALGFIPGEVGRAFVIASGIMMLLYTFKSDLRYLRLALVILSVIFTVMFAITENNIILILYLLILKGGIIYELKTYTNKSSW